MKKKNLSLAAFALFAIYGLLFADVGIEKSLPQHLADGEEFTVSLEDLLRHGAAIFNAVWTSQEGGGRPLSNGTGAPLADPSSPLVFPRNFNRISGPESNSCFGCHAHPRAGGGGDIVTNVFVLGQRFDFVTFDTTDPVRLRGSRDEQGNFVTLPSIADERATLGMFGSGYIELLAREMTYDLQTIRNSTPPGGANALASKGVSFGEIRRNIDGAWDTSAVEGIPAVSLVTTGSDAPPSLIIRPFHQAGRVASLREFSTNAFHQHHGMQATERFGSNTDPDGDGFENELTRADMTAVSVWQATLAVPGQVIPRDPEVQAAIMLGETLFSDIGCDSCHRKELPLGSAIFTEPNPFNPPGNLQPGEAPTYRVDLNSKDLPQPRLEAGHDGVIQVPAFTDLKLHDITSGPDDPNAEPLDMQHPGGSPEFFAGNTKFLTKKLWGAANEPPYFHHGKFSTLRQAVLAHAGEALSSREQFEALSARERDSVIEFLKSLQVLPEGTKFTIVDEDGQPRQNIR